MRVEVNPAGLKGMCFPGYEYQPSPQIIPAEKMYETSFINFRFIFICRGLCTLAHQAIGGLTQDDED